VRNKETFWHAVYNRLRSRIGPKKALIAIAHKMIISAYWILKNQVPYKELGANFADQKLHAKRAKYYTKQLEALGFKVQLESLQTMVNS